MAEQLDHERRLTGDATAKALFREMVKIPGNRKRALISIMLMVCQQMTGVNAIVCNQLISPNPKAPHANTKTL